jgi:hypothetical protein
MARFAGRKQKGMFTRIFVRDMPHPNDDKPEDGEVLVDWFAEQIAARFLPELKGDSIYKAEWNEAREILIAFGRELVAACAGPHQVGHCYGCSMSKADCPENGTDAVLENCERILKGEV